MAQIATTLSKLPPSTRCWCRADGPLLAAVRGGAWVLLDELNLASQTVLEGLNAVLDHRAEVGGRHGSSSRLEKAAVHRVTGSGRWLAACVDYSACRSAAGLCQPLSSQGVF